jgi:hypothetical protein
MFLDCWQTLFCIQTSPDQPVLNIMLDSDCVAGNYQSLLCPAKLHFQCLCFLLHHTKTIFVSQSIINTKLFIAVLELHWLHIQNQDNEYKSSKSSTHPHLGTCLCSSAQWSDDIFKTCLHLKNCIQFSTSNVKHKKHWIFVSGLFASSSQTRTTFVCKRCLITMSVG